MKGFQVQGLKLMVRGGSAQLCDLDLKLGLLAERLFFFVFSVLLGCRVARI